MLFQLFLLQSYTSDTNLLRYASKIVDHASEMKDKNHYFLIDTSSTRIHSILINEDYITIRILCNKSLLNIDLIRPTARNLTLKQILSVLQDYQTDNDILCVTRIGGSLFTADDLANSLRELYKQVVTDYSLFDGPSKFYNQSGVGYYEFDNKLFFHFNTLTCDKYYGFQWISSDTNFFDKTVAEFLINDTRCSIKSEKIMSHIMARVPLYKFIYQYLSRDRTDSFNVNKLIKDLTDKYKIEYNSKGNLILNMDMDSTLEKHEIEKKSFLIAASVMLYEFLS